MTTQTVVEKAEAAEQSVLLDSLTCVDCGEPVKVIHERPESGGIPSAAFDSTRTQHIARLVPQPSERSEPTLLEQVGEALVAVHVADVHPDADGEGDPIPLVQFMDPELFDRVTTAVAAYSAREPARPADTALREAANAIESVLTSMDWLGTGSSSRTAAHEERKAWRQWGVILSALGDSRDPYKRTYETGGDALATQPTSSEQDR